MYTSAKEEVFLPLKMKAKSNCNPPFLLPVTHPLCMVLCHPCLDIMGEHYRRYRGLSTTSCQISFEFLLVKTCPSTKNKIWFRFVPLCSIQIESSILSRDIFWSKGIQKKFGGKWCLNPGIYGSYCGSVESGAKYLLSEVLYSTKWVKHERQNTTHNTHNNNQLKPPPPYSPAAFPSLSVGRAAAPSNHGPPLPKAMHRPQAVGLAFAVIDLLVWGGIKRGIKK